MSKDKYEYKVQYKSLSPETQRGWFDCWTGPWVSKKEVKRIQRGFKKFKYKDRIKFRVISRIKNF